MNKIIIAIDGYSSCGKSTLAKQLAQALNYIYIDTGAMYRAITLFALRNDMIKDDQVDVEKLKKKLNTIEVSFAYNTQLNISETYLNGENVEKEIREIIVSNKVSKIAKIEEVRAKLVEIQRVLGKDKGLVMDGRDIGSVVFPDADLKLFMTAHYTVRAKRRYDELKAKNNKVSYEEVLANIESRDNDDTSRTSNPLIQVADAIVIDNSEITPKEQFDIALKLAKDKIAAVN
ncbi:MAG: (d)CMP kinase [Vicingus serpentipes]|nr:(d)CMP kinase [Vicingus serpentipes]